MRKKRQPLSGKNFPRIDELKNMDEGFCRYKSLRSFPKGVFSACSVFGGRGGRSIEVFGGCLPATQAYRQNKNRRNAATEIAGGKTERKRLLCREKQNDICGIIGYTGTKEAQKIIIEGLKALEYRGYDSAGMAAFDEYGILHTVKSSGKIVNLEAKMLTGAAFSSRTAIGHTRWATHGAPTDYNSHPHGTDRVMMVHNGIIENEARLRETLLEKGMHFHSETDTEVAAVLVDSLYKGDPIAAIREALKRIRGSYAFGILFTDVPGKIFAVRSGSPLIVGIGEKENFIASDVTPILKYTRRYIALDEGFLAVVSGDGVTVYDRGGDETECRIETARWDVHAAERGGFPHFMKKEIHEEPEAIQKTLSPRITGGLPDFSGEGLDVNRIAQARKITLVACGTAMHAAYTAKLAIEKYALIPCAV
ncbi:MAG: hypothetical protein MJ078_01540, partial [Clostridia bacterium]|nr:hypothetical protein [Clostridia bacterium]